MGKWNDFAQSIRGKLGKGGEVKLTIEEIVRATETTDTGVREPSWWEAAKKGGESARALAEEQIALDYTVVDGQVREVTFWLDFLPPKHRQGK